MVTFYPTLEEARAARAEMPKEVGGFAVLNYIRKTLDGRYAVIPLEKDCYFTIEHYRRYNLPVGAFDFDEPDE